MKKEKTLYEKRISWHEEGISYNGKVFKEVHLTNGDKILREKDVKQFIKEILDEIDKWKIRDYPKNSQKDIGWNNAILNVIDFIKQKAGFEELK